MPPPEAYCRHFESNPPHPYQPPICYGTKPALILRGEHPGGRYAGVHDCYLLRFEGIILKAGGIAYQQLYSAPHGRGETIGYFEFKSIVMEESWTPLLDIFVDPALEASQNYSLITIDHFMSADADPKNHSMCAILPAEPNLCTSPRCGWFCSLRVDCGLAFCLRVWERAPLVRFNCTQPHCTLGGVSISGVGMVEHAVEVVNGQIGGYGGGVTVLSSQSVVDVAVDVEGHSLGGTVGRSASGLAVVGNAIPNNPQEASANNSLKLGSHGTAAVAVSAAGDSAARFAVSAAGHVSWGDGAGVGLRSDTMPPTATLGTVPSLGFGPPETVSGAPEIFSIRNVLYKIS